MPAGKCIQGPTCDDLLTNCDQIDEVAPDVSKRDHHVLQEADRKVPETRFPILRLMENLTTEMYRESGSPPPPPSPLAQMFSSPSSGATP